MLCTDALMDSTDALLGNWCLVGGTLPVLCLRLMLCTGAWLGTVALWDIAGAFGVLPALVQPSQQK